MHASYLHAGCNAYFLRARAFGHWFPKDSEVSATSLLGEKDESIGRLGGGAIPILEQSVRSTRDVDSPGD